MRHRIRAAALITQGDSILLVQHVHPQTGVEWWVPPGGGLEPTDPSVFDCARRETFEETGLSVDLSRIVYVREFHDQEHGTRNLELFLSCDSFSGNLTTSNIHGNGPDEQYIRSVRWIPKNELQDIVVYPEILKSEFWNDLTNGFPETKYLGTQIG